MVNHRRNKGVFLLILLDPVRANNELVFSFCFRPPSFFSGFVTVVVLFVFVVLSSHPL